MGTLFGLLLVGLAVETLQATVGVAVTMVITWAALLFVLYTWWAAVRPGVLSVVGGS